MIGTSNSTNSEPDKRRPEIAAKKTYLKPAFRVEHVCETAAVCCGTGYLAKYSVAELKTGNVRSAR